MTNLLVTVSFTRGTDYAVDTVNTPSNASGQQAMCVFADATLIPGSITVIWPYTDKAWRSAMTNTVTVNADNVAEFFGVLASPFAYKQALRHRITALYDAAHVSANRFFVLDSDGNCYAAQSTRSGADHYMKPDRILVEIQL